MADTDITWQITTRGERVVSIRATLSPDLTPEQRELAGRYVFRWRKVIGQSLAAFSRNLTAHPEDEAERTAESVYYAGLRQASRDAESEDDDYVPPPSPGETA